MNRVTEYLAPSAPAVTDRSDEPLNLELCELLDEAREILRKEIGESVNDLYLIQAHWLREREEFRLSIRPVWQSKWCWQSWDSIDVLDSLRSQVVMVRREVEWLKREGMMT